MNITTNSCNYGFNWIPPGDPHHGRNPELDGGRFRLPSPPVIGDQCNPGYGPIDQAPVRVRRRRRRHCNGHQPYYMQNHQGHGCYHPSRLKVVGSIGNPVISGAQGSYLDQLQGNDQKRAESEARLKKMGFQQVTGGYSGYKVPSGGTLWTRGGSGFGGIKAGPIESVSLAPDGTVAPAT